MRGWWAGLTIACTAPDLGDADGDGAPASIDCDDTNPAVRPGAAEICNGIDDDCDQQIDDADDTLVLSTGLTFHADTDRDGFGDPADPVQACAPPDGFVLDATDCNPSDGAVHPGALEVCNDGVDDDCNGWADDVDPGLERSLVPTWYADLDGDSFGDASDAVVQCLAPPGRVSNGDDCDDTRSDVFPGAPERCNGVDDDCDVTSAESGVWWHDEGGAWLDETATFGAGSAELPSVFLADGAGTLYVCEGRWHTRLVADGDLTVLGPAGSGLTVLDGGYTSHLDEGILVQATPGATLTLEGVTLTNSVDGIDAYAADLVLRDAVLRELGADGAGRAIDHYLGDLEVTSTQLTDNLGEILVVSVHSDVVFDDVAMTDNQLEASTVQLGFVSAAVLGGTWAGNSADVGGAFFLIGTDVTFEGVTITGNRARYGGGVGSSSLGATTFDHRVTFVDSTITGNVATIRGGGVYHELDGALSFTDTLVSGNEATEGGGLHITSGAETSMTCDGSPTLAAGFLDNSAVEGGGIYVYDRQSLYETGAYDQVAHLDLIECDFGTTDKDDNSPEDLATYLYERDCVSSGDGRCENTESTTTQELGDDVTACLGLACPP